MFDKYLCKHIQKSGISVWDIIKWITTGNIVKCVVFVLIGSYSAGKLFCVVTNVDGWGILEKVGDGFLIISLLSIGVTGVQLVFEAKVAHCPLKKDK